MSWFNLLPILAGAAASIPIAAAFVALRSSRVEWEAKIHHWQRSYGNATFELRVRGVSDESTIFVENQVLTLFELADERLRAEGIDERDRRKVLELLDGVFSGKESPSPSRAGVPA